MFKGKKITYTVLFAFILFSGSIGAQQHKTWLKLDNQYSFASAASNCSFFIHTTSSDSEQGWLYKVPLSNEVLDSVLVTSGSTDGFFTYSIELRDSLIWLFGNVLDTMQPTLNPGNSRGAILRYDYALNFLDSVHYGYKGTDFYQAIFLNNHVYISAAEFRGGFSRPIYKFRQKDLSLVDSTRLSFQNRLGHRDASLVQLPNTTKILVVDRSARSHIVDTNTMSVDTNFLAWDRFADGELFVFDLISWNDSVRALSDSDKPNNRHTPVLLRYSMDSFNLDPTPLVSFDSTQNASYVQGSYAVMDSLIFFAVSYPYTSHPIISTGHFTSSMLYAVDFSGNIKWQTRFFNENNWVVDVSANDSSIFVVYRWVSVDEPHLDAQVHVMKFDHQGRNFDLGLEQSLAPLGGMDVYPNPVRGRVFYDARGLPPAMRQFRWQLRNAAGQSLQDKILPQREGELDLSQLSSGTYFYQLSSGDEFIRSGSLVIE